MTCPNTTLSCWRGSTIVWIVSCSMPFSPWGRPAAAYAAGGETSTATTRTWMTSICAIWQTFSRRLHAFCAKQEIPIIEARTGERKHELAEPHLPKDPTFSGLFLVITGKCAGAGLGGQTQYRWADYRNPPPQELAVRQALPLSHHGSRMGSCDDPHVRLSPLRCAADLERP